MRFWLGEPTMWLFLRVWWKIKSPRNRSESRLASLKAKHMAASKLKLGGSRMATLQSEFLQEFCL
ncbi:hypothetical protein GOP47_0014891 [Adiantum capillus-veneris]|uniref:Uncharacterized protein n=1 Tax=Adiantum capillus-veneris TaxID=13818 RepID=A0A9D4UNK5_ADICA|nr:hypothetical protein GOP47_0014891 [Adiantum capillus-veneris]